MANVVEQIEHPAIKEMREEMAAKYEVEIAQVREEMQEQIDDLQGNVDERDHAFNTQTKILDKIFWNKETGKEDEKIDLTTFKTRLAERMDRDMSSWEEDYSVLHYLPAILEKITITPKVEYIAGSTIYATRYVEKEAIFTSLKELPASIKYQGYAYQLFITKTDETTPRWRIYYSTVGQVKKRLIETEPGANLDDVAIAALNSIEDLNEADKHD